MTENPSSMKGTTTGQLMAEISQYWSNFQGSNLYNLMDVYNSRVEKLGDNAEKIAEWRQLDNASGTTLDLMGEDREAYRPSSDDKMYRFLIYIKYLISRAEGTIPSIVNITEKALQSDQGADVFNTSPHHISIKVPFSEVTDAGMAKLILSNLRKLVGLGYWLDDVIWNIQTNSILSVGAVCQVTQTYTTQAKLLGETTRQVDTHDYGLNVTTQAESHTTVAK